MEEWEAMQVLKAAHTVGLAIMDSLEQASADLIQGRRSEALEVLERVLQFFDGDLKLHFDHEEHALFPVLGRIIGRAGPIGAMEGEHDSLWRNIDDLGEGVRVLERDVMGADEQLILDLHNTANHIVWMLRSHIQKEDTMLFPLADKTLDERGKTEVDTNMRMVEQLAQANLHQ